MPVLAKLGVASLVAGLAFASPAFDDTSVLVQQRREMQAVNLEEERIVSSWKGKGWGAGKICTAKDFEVHDAKVKEYRNRMDEMHKEKKAKAAENVAREVNATKERMTVFIQPMLDALDQTGKYLEAECQPTGLAIVKHALQTLFAGPLVNESSMIDINKTITEFLQRWDKEIVVHTRALLQSGFGQLHERIEAAMANYSTALQSKIFKARFPVHNETDLKDYVAYKALPVVTIESDPVTKKWAEVWAKMPENQTELQTYVQKTLVPSVVKELPSKCQPSRLFTTLGLGMGDVGSRISKFVGKCVDSLGFERDPPAPERTCKTCQEHYLEQTLEVGSMNSCVVHCMPVAASCSGGVSNGCVKAVHPCFRCHKKKIEMLDDCEGTSKRAKMATMLGKLADAFKDGSVEKNAISGFVDKVVNAMIP